MRRVSVSIILFIVALLAYPFNAQNSNRLDIKAKQNLAIQNEPSFDSDVTGIFGSGDTLVAFGRNNDGTWVQVALGWVISKHVTSEGDIMSLPVTTEAVLVTASSNQNLRSGPDESFDRVGTFTKDVPTMAVGRNDKGNWIEIQGGWLRALSVDLQGEVMLLPETFAAFTIATLQDAPIYVAPFRTSEVLGTFLDGDEAIAIGRNVDGTAVQTPRGWLFVNYTFTLGGRIEILPPVSLFTVNVTRDSKLYSLPNLKYEMNTVVPSGEQVIAIGRNSSATWIEISGGWVKAGQTVEPSGEIMSLPFTGYSDGIKVKYTGSSAADVLSAPGC